MSCTANESETRNVYAQVKKMTVESLMKNFFLKKRRRRKALCMRSRIYEEQKRNTILYSWL